MSQKSPPWDAIVVGAGFAGVVAARELSHAGWRVLIVEARDRPGGLTWTTEFSGNQVELGGTWIHWFQPHVWAEVSRYGLRTDQSPSPERAVWFDGTSRRRGDLYELFGPLADALSRFCANAADVFPLPYEPFVRAERLLTEDHSSLADRLEASGLDEHQIQLLSALYTPLCGCSLSDAGSLIALHEFALAGCDVGNFLATTATYKLANGSAELLQAILSDGASELCLGKAVRAVHQSSNEVSLDIEDGDLLAASCAVLTVPINTLGRIRFDPTLSEEKESAIREGQPSNGVKIWARTRDKVEEFVGLAPNDQPLSFVRTEKVDNEGTLLVGIGRGTDILDPSDREAITEAFRLFVPNMELEGTITHNWSTDPWSNGTWPVFRPGQRSRLLPSLQKPEGKLFFAGGLTANGWTAFIDGAIESGLRAAREANEYLTRH